MRHDFVDIAGRTVCARCENEVLRVDEECPALLRYERDAVCEWLKTVIAAADGDRPEDNDADTLDRLAIEAGRLLRALRGEK